MSIRFVGRGSSELIFTDRCVRRNNSNCSTRSEQRLSVDGGFDCLEGREALSPAGEAMDLTNEADDGSYRVGWDFLLTVGTKAA